MGWMRIMDRLSVACVVALAAFGFALLPTEALAARTENVESPPRGLPDQTFQHITFATALSTSLITVADRSGTGHRSFLVTFHVSGGGFFSFQLKEGQNDIVLPLPQAVSITGLSIRCDSFISVVCQS